MPVLERFWHYTDKRGPDECWLWKGSAGQSGYGQLTVQNKHYSSHRLAFMLLVGPIVHRDVCHSCDVRLCVNPSHLFNASHSVNMKDAVSKGRCNAMILKNIEIGKARENERRIRREEIERLKKLGPQLGPDGKFRDWAGRICKEGQVARDPKRDKHGQFKGSEYSYKMWSDLRQAVFVEWKRSGFTASAESVSSAISRSLKCTSKAMLWIQAEMRNWTHRQRVPRERDSRGFFIKRQP